MATTSALTQKFVNEFDFDEMWAEQRLLSEKAADFVDEFLSHRTSLTGA